MNLSWLQVKQLICFSVNLSPQKGSYIPNVQNLLTTYAVVNQNYSISVPLEL